MSTLRLKPFTMPKIAVHKRGAAWGSVVGEPKQFSSWSAVLECSYKLLKIMITSQGQHGLFQDLIEPVCRDTKPPPNLQPRPHCMRWEARRRQMCCLKPGCYCHWHTHLLCSHGTILAATARASSRLAWAWVLYSVAFPSPCADSVSTKEALPSSGDASRSTSHKAAALCSLDNV